MAAAPHRPHRFPAQRPIVRHAAPPLVVVEGPVDTDTDEDEADGTVDMPVEPSPAPALRRPTGRLLQRWRFDHETGAKTDVIVLVSRSAVYKERENSVAICPLRRFNGADLRLLTESDHARQRLYYLTAVLGLLHTDGECCAGDEEGVRKSLARLERERAGWETAATHEVPGAAALLAATKRWEAALRTEAVCGRLACLAGLSIAKLWEGP